MRIRSYRTGEKPWSCSSVRTARETRWDISLWMCPRKTFASFLIRSLWRSSISSSDTFQMFKKAYMTPSPQKKTAWSPWVGCRHMSLHCYPAIFRQPRHCWWSPSEIVSRCPGRQYSQGLKAAHFAKYASTCWYGRKEIWREVLSRGPRKKLLPRSHSSQSQGRDFCTQGPVWSYRGWLRMVLILHHCCDGSD